MYGGIAHGARVGIMLLVGTGMSHIATARDIHVCSTCAHTSIQSAVDAAAASGDKIDIGAGRYVENVTITGKQLTLLGAGGGANGFTEVVAAGRGPVFTLGSGAAGEANRLIEIHNLTISHGNHTGGTGVGGGVQVRAGAYLHLFDSVVTRNSATSGGGIGVNSPGAPATTIIRCLIDDNVASGPRPNGAPGGGVAVLGGSAASIQQSTIARNQSTEGGGVYGATGSSLTITSTTVTGNTSNSVSTKVGPRDGDGGGLATAGDFAISDSFFVDNTATGEGGGGGVAIFVADNGIHTINRSIVSHNTVASGVGGGIFAFGDAGQAWTLEESYVVQNLAAFGVWNQGPVALVLIDTTIKGNVGGELCDGGC